MKRLVEEVTRDPVQHRIAVEQRAKELSKSRAGKALYERYLGDARPLLLCFGPGGGFHPAWTTVDRCYDERMTWSEMHGRPRGPDPDHEWNALECRPLPLEDGAAQMIYCSHMIEHLPVSEAQWFLKECHRLLRPGGVLRIVTPDQALAADAYERGDWMFFLEHQVLHEGVPAADALCSALATERGQRDYAARRLLDMFTMLLHPLNAGPNGITRDTCASFISGCSSVEDAMDKACRLGDDSLGRRVGGHMSCWTYPKLERSCRIAGFSVVTRSGFRQSRSPLMRHPFYFDRTDPHMSLYAEAVK